MSHAPGSPDIGPTTAYYEGIAAERERIIGLIHKFREECDDQINYYAKLDEPHQVKRYVHWVQAIDDIRDILGDTEDKEQK